MRMKDSKVTAEKGRNDGRGNTSWVGNAAGQGASLSRAGHKSYNTEKNMGAMEGLHGQLSNMTAPRISCTICLGVYM